MRCAEESELERSGRVLNLPSPHHCCRWPCYTSAVSQRWESPQPGHSGERPVWTEAAFAAVLGDTGQAESRARDYLQGGNPKGAKRHGPEGPLRVSQGCWKEARRGKEQAVGREQRATKPARSLVRAVFSDPDGRAPASTPLQQRRLKHRLGGRSRLLRNTRRQQ